MLLSLVLPLPQATVKNDGISRTAHSRHNLFHCFFFETPAAANTSANGVNRAQAARVMCEIGLSDATLGAVTVRVEVAGLAFGVTDN